MKIYEKESSGAGSWQVTLLKQGKRGIIFNWNISTMHPRHPIPPFPKINMTVLRY